MPGGQPTKYHDGIPELFLAAMKAGKTNVQFCAEIDICVDTLWEWRRVHKEFSEAYARGRAKCQSHWEGWLDNNLTNNKVNSGLVKLKFVNQFGYSDKKEVQQTQTQTITLRQETQDVLDVRKKYESPV